MKILVNFSVICSKVCSCCTCSEKKICISVTVHGIYVQYVLLLFKRSRTGMENVHIHTHHVLLTPVIPCWLGLMGIALSYYQDGCMCPSSGLDMSSAWAASWSSSRNSWSIISLPVRKKPILLSLFWKSQYIYISWNYNRQIFTFCSYFKATVQWDLLFMYRSAL